MTNLLAFRRASTVPQQEVNPAPPAAPAPVAVSTPAVSTPAVSTPAVSTPAPPATKTPRRRSRFTRLRGGDDRVAHLRRSAVVAGWAEADVKALAACADEVTAEAGHIIEADVYPYRWWWLVLEGSVAVSTEGEPVTVLGPGHGVGLDRPEQSTRRVTLTALDDVRLLVGNRQQMLGASDTNPRIHDLVDRSLGR